MAWTADTYFEDVTPDFQKSWSNNEYLAPSAVEVKAGSVMELPNTATKVIGVIDAAANAKPAGLLVQNVKDLDAGPISGIRDFVTNDVNYSEPVTLIRGSQETFIRMGAQNATDYQCGWIVSSAINVDTSLYAAHHGGASDGGITDDNTMTTVFGRSLKQVSAATDILEFYYDPDIL